MISMLNCMHQYCGLLMYLGLVAGALVVLANSVMFQYAVEGNNDVILNHSVFGFAQFLPNIQIKGSVGFCIMCMLLSLAEQLLLLDPDEFKTELNVATLVFGAMTYALILIWSFIV